jgi:GDP-D-mannose dehydratase
VDLPVKRFAKNNSVNNELLQNGNEVLALDPKFFRPTAVELLIQENLKK